MWIRSPSFSPHSNQEYTSWISPEGKYEKWHPEERPGGLRVKGAVRTGPSVGGFGGGAEAGGAAERAHRPSNKHKGGPGE